MALQHGVASQSTFARWICRLLIVGMIVDGIAVLSGFAEFALLSRALGGARIGDTEVENNDTRQAVIGGIQFVIFLATAIAWLLWVRRAYGNLRQMGTAMTRFSPGWAVGCWFVPIMNLFRPFQLVKDLWRRSSVGNTLATVDHLPSPPVLSWWWGLYLTSNLLGQIYFRASAAAQALNSLLAVTTLGIGVDAIGIASAILALIVVRKIDDLQKAAALGAPTPGT